MQSFLALLARLSIAAFFFWNGITQAFAHAHTVEKMRAAGIPHAGILFYVPVIVQLGGSILLALGARTRLAALLLALLLVPVAYYAHFDFGNPEQVIEFFQDLAIFGGLLSIVAYGPGRASLDGR